MSGGVDSSVAAHLLRDAGYEVVGAFMRHGEPPTECSSDAGAELPVLSRPDHKQGCCSATDAEDARRVADSLDIPFYALNLRDQFSEIMDYFVDEYVSGRTPNPCVMCNNWLKFGKLYDYADSIGAHYVATGHYARLYTDSDGRRQLLRGKDRSKDQSYVLFGVKQSLLSRMLLPVGEFTKRDIRTMADRLDMRVARKRDSQEICFVPSGKHAEFVAHRKQNVDTAGDLVTTDGTIVGQHTGIERFTIGQRKGLGVAMGEPYFVVSIENETKRVVIGRHEELARQALVADRTNWLIDPPLEPIRCQVQIRYNSEAKPAIARVDEDGLLRVEFEQPNFGIAPGQAVVCYDGDRVMGGGWILESEERVEADALGTRTTQDRSSEKR